MSEQTMTRGMRGKEATRTTVEATERGVGSAIDTAFDTGMAWWDMMLRMQRASLSSLSVYSPRSDTRISATRPMQGSSEAVLQVGEERLNIATQTLPGETTRIRRRVVETPVEQDVTLREERVVIERRPGAPGDAAKGEVFVETVIEMSDSRQVPQVWKSIHVAEEVVLRRDVTERTERVRETLKRDVIDVEHGERKDRAALARPAEQEMGRAIAAGAAEGAAKRAEPECDAPRQAEQAAEERRRREQAKDQPQPAPAGRKP